MTDHELDIRTRENIFIEKKMYTLFALWKKGQVQLTWGFFLWDQVMHFTFPSPQTTTKIFDPLPYLWKSSTCELRNVAWNVMFWSVLTVLHVLQSADGLLDCYCLLLLLFVGFLVNVTFFKPGFLSKYHHWWHVN